VEKATTNTTNHEGRSEDEDEDLKTENINAEDNSEAMEELYQSAALTLAQSCKSLSILFKL